MNPTITLLLLAFLIDGVLEGVRWKDYEKYLLAPHDVYHPLIGLRNAAFLLAPIIAIYTPPNLWNFAGAWLLGNLGFRETAINQITRGKVPWRKQDLLGFPRFPVIELLVAVLVGGWLCLVR